VVAIEVALGAIGAFREGDGPLGGRSSEEDPNVDAANSGTPPAQSDTSRRPRADDDSERSYGSYLSTPLV
jgi:hypothetical protein